MKADIYKLGEYKIIVSDSGDLSWEAHFGLGSLKEGSCFRKGTILFIGPAESSLDGFLKLEFMAHLKGHPDWLKTKYYCRGFEIYHCKTGRKVTKKEMQLWVLGPDTDNGDRRYSENREQPFNDISTRRAVGDVSYRLQRYQIIKKSNEQIIWKTRAGPNTFTGGTCAISEDILFMGPGQNEQAHLNKRQFFANLEQLPEWHQTKYYTPKLSVHDCKSANGIQKERKRWPSARRAAEKHDARKGGRAGKCIKYAADVVFLIISLFFGYLDHLWKELKGRWQ